MLPPYEQALSALLLKRWGVRHAKSIIEVYVHVVRQLWCSKITNTWLITQLKDEEATGRGSATFNFSSKSLASLATLLGFLVIGGSGDGAVRLTLSEKWLGSGMFSQNNSQTWYFKGSHSLK